MQASQAKSSTLEEPPPSRRAEIRRGPAHQADLIAIDVDAMTTRDGHASTGKPSATFVVKLATSHLFVEGIQQRKHSILEVERKTGKQM